LNKKKKVKDLLISSNWFANFNNNIFLIIEKKQKNKYACVSNSVNKIQKQQQQKQTTTKKTCTLISEKSTNISDGIAENENVTYETLDETQLSKTIVALWCNIIVHLKIF
jgi:hypothetical protein